MKRKEITKPGFSVFHDKDDHYYKTRILIYAEPDSSGDEGHIEMEWQSNAAHRGYYGSDPCEDSEWSLYGQHVGINFDSFPQYERLTRLFKSLFGHLNEKYGDDNARPRYLCPVEICQALIGAVGTKKIVQVINDQRAGGRIPIEDVKPKEWKSYRDDWERCHYEDSSTGCTVGCVADSDEEAQRLLTIEFATRSTYGYDGYRGKRMEKWLASGRPVRMVYDDVPYVLKVDDMMSNIIEAQNQRAAKEELKRKEQEAEIMAGQNDSIITEPVPETAPAVREEEVAA